MSQLLCSCCQTIFDNVPLHQGWVGATVLHGFKAGGLSPKSCRMCAIIFAEHRQGKINQRDINQLGGNHSDSVDILKITYSCQPLNASRAMCLTILLYYAEDRCITFQLAIAAEKDLPEGFQWNTNLSLDTLSPLSLQFLKHKLENCLENHERCCKRSNMNANWHPTRLIHLGIREGLGTATLVDGQKADRSPYNSLSHCWGGYAPLKLNSSEEISLRKGRPIDEFPKTFRDAMRVSLELGVHYLWIDSLCILQDSKDDQLKEISSMHDVYSHALCNLAATSASNCAVGLSFSRDSRAKLPFLVAKGQLNEPGSDDSVKLNQLVFPPGSSWFDTIEGGPLNQRAWVMQESLLSTRVLHFTQSQLIWECYEEQTLEICPELPTPTDQDKRHSYPLTYLEARYIDKISLGYPHIWRGKGGEISHGQFYLIWEDLVNAYTKRFLSFEDDRLPAISAIVNQLRSILGLQYVAGFWRAQLPEPLLWTRASGYDETPTAATWCSKTRHAPTWSWANVNVPVWPTGLSRHRNKVVLNSATVDDISSDEVPTLKLRGQLLRCTLHQLQDRGEASLQVENPRDLYSMLGGKLLISAFLDDPTLHFPYKENLVCLKIFEYEPEKDKEDPIRVAGLILRVVNATEQIYERAGMFYVHGPAYELYRFNESKNVETVKII